MRREEGVRGERRESVLGLLTAPKSRGRTLSLAAPLLHHGLAGKG
jgi:hypothetical protein